MPTPTSAPPASAIKLGQILRRERMKQGIAAIELSRRSKLSRSYISFLEAGDYGQIRIDKLADIVRILELDIQQVLEEAGYLPKRSHILPDLTAYLRQRYSMSEVLVQDAVRYVEYLVSQGKKKK